MTTYTRARQAYSTLQQERLATPCIVPKVIACSRPKGLTSAPATSASETLQELFPTTHQSQMVCFRGDNGSGAAPLVVGVMLSGGQAPGGHNVIAGLHDSLKRAHPDSQLVGFLDGPHGLFSCNYVFVTDDMMNGFRNTGGFDMLGSGRHKIETSEQFQKSKKVTEKLNLDGLVIIGGDDSNTNAALLAEYFRHHKMKTCVVGCPKTIDGDLKCPPHIPVSFGFDTACRTYAELVGNVAVDALSAQKYYHFVRLMGRSASNIALEVALLCNPNACLIGEEIIQTNQSLKGVTLEIVAMIIERSRLGKNYGVVLLPEGLIEFIPEFKMLIDEINEIMSHGSHPSEEAISADLSDVNRAVFNYLPSFIRQELLLDRDPHGNVQVAKIETEKLLAAMIEIELDNARKEGRYSGSFKPQFHAFGYEGRAGLPSTFDANYCYALGCTASSLIGDNHTGVIASVRNLTAPYEEWECGGVPVVSLCVIERRKGKNIPVIRKAVVELDGPFSQPFHAWKDIRDKLKVIDAYKSQIPVQYNKGAVGYDAIPETLRLELGGKPALLAKEETPITMHVPWPSPNDSFLYFGKRLRSDAEAWRASQPYQIPAALDAFHPSKVQLVEGQPTQSPSQRDSGFVRKHFCATYGQSLLFFEKLDVSKDRKVPFKLDGRVGVLYCGRQAPGGHDIVHGIVSFAPGGWEVLGFIGGTEGFFAKQHVILTPELTRTYARTGGLELLGRTQDKLIGREKVAKEACEELKLNGLILIGGARTNTAAVRLAEYFSKNACKTVVVGVPMGMGGSLQTPFVEQSIGFDSNTKAVARLVGNTAVDGASARKYWYFLRIMEGSSTGRSMPTSHVTLEVAMQTKPNYCIFSEVVTKQRESLQDVVSKLCDVICHRADNGKNFGTVLVPDSLLGAVSDFSSLIHELQKVDLPQPLEKVLPQLSVYSGALLQSLPDFIGKQLLSTKQSNAVLALSQVATEQLISGLTAQELDKRKANGTYKGKFSSVCQFLGYQARCSVPSNFDSNLAYSLGGAACNLVLQKKNGYMVSASGLHKKPTDWKIIGVPITAVLEVCEGNEPVIAPRPLTLNGPVFEAWNTLAGRAAAEELYENPGPIQFSGKTQDSVTHRISCHQPSDNYVTQLTELTDRLGDISSLCRPGCDMGRLRVANKALTNLRDIINELAVASDKISLFNPSVDADDESPSRRKQGAEFCPLRRNPELS